MITFGAHVNLGNGAAGRVVQAISALAEQVDLLSIQLVLFLLDGRICASKAAHSIDGTVMEDSPQYCFAQSLLSGEYHLSFPPPFTALLETQDRLRQRSVSNCLSLKDSLESHVQDSTLEKCKRIHVAIRTQQQVVQRDKLDHLMTLRVLREKHANARVYYWPVLYTLQVSPCHSGQLTLQIHADDALFWLWRQQSGSVVSIFDEGVAEENARLFLQCLRDWAILTCTESASVFWFSDVEGSSNLTEYVEAKIPELQMQLGLTDSY